MWEELVPHEVGVIIRDAGKNGKEVVFESVDGEFSYVAAMATRQEKLESAVPILNDGATILGDGFIVEDLEINTVDFGLEATHDAIVGSNAMAVIA